MKKWVCTVCGYIHEGDEAPEICPLCGVDSSQFELVEEQQLRITRADLWGIFGSIAALVPLVCTDKYSLDYAALLLNKNLLPQVRCSCERKPVIHKSKIIFWFATLVRFILVCYNNSVKLRNIIAFKLAYTTDKK